MGARIGENRADLTFRCSSHRATYYGDCKQFIALSTWVITVSSLCSECSTAPHSGLAGVVVTHMSELTSCFWRSDDRAVAFYA